MLPPDHDQAGDDDEYDERHQERVFGKVLTQTFAPQNAGYYKFLREIGGTVRK